MARNAVAMRDVVLTFTSQADALGRREFRIEWHDGHCPRGQCFHADPAPHIARLEREAGPITVVEGVPLTRDEAFALAAELTAQLARTSGVVAFARVRGEMLVFDLAEERPGRTPHRICWSTRTRDEAIAHWRGYTGQVSP